jgi:tRNA(Ile)-lysidine synthase
MERKLMNLLTETEAVIKQTDLIRPDDHVLTGVSGGPDSMALISILQRLSITIPFKLYAVHLHHGIRNEADDDEELILKWCRKNGIKCFCRHIDVKKFASDYSMSVEEAGRHVRRSLFDDVSGLIGSHTHNGARIVTALAHHKNDQAETMILNLSRGTGLAGLAGMKIQDEKYIRPFLKFSRQDIFNWLQSEKIPWNHDQTNDETVYTRNRIRHLLLPHWEQITGNDPVELLARTSENLAEDEACLENLSAKQFDSAYIPERGLPAEIILAQPRAIVFRMMKKLWLMQVGTLKDISRKHFLLMKEVAEGQIGPCDLPHGIVALLNNGYITLKRKDVKDENAVISSADWEISLIIPGKTVLPETYGSIEAAEIEYNPDFRYNSEMNCFRLELIDGCVIRLRRPGDTIKPAGRQVTKSLKKFMNELKIPPELRQKIPLVACGNDVIWMPRYACGNDYIIRGRSKSSGIRLVWNNNIDNNREANY